MTKSDLIQKLSTNTGQTKADTERLLEAVITTVTSALEQGETVELRGLGRFQVNNKKERTGRNPKTGEALTIPAKRVPAFRPSKEFATRLNSDGAAPAQS